MDLLEEGQAAVGDPVVDHQHVDLLVDVDLGGRGRIGEKPQPYAGNRLQNALMVR